VYVRFTNEIHVVVVVVVDTKISSKSHKSPYQHYVNGGVYVISDRSRTITQVPLSTVCSFYVGWGFVFCRLYLFNVPISWNNNTCMYVLQMKYMLLLLLLIQKISR